MSTKDQAPFGDWDGPSFDKFEKIVKRALGRLAGEVPEDPSEPASTVTAEDAAELVERSLQSGGLIPSPALPGETHPLASAGTKLKDLRTKSGWTAEEIAERTGFPIEILMAFEDGDSAAAGEVTVFDLEILESACCGTLADLLHPEHSWVKAAEGRQYRFGPSCAIDPTG